MKYKFYVLIASVLFISGCLSLVAPKVKPGLVSLREGQYKLDPKHASLLFKVDHLGLSTYVGRFNRFDASLDFNPEDISASRLEAKIETGSIDVNNAEFSETLAGEDWLDAQNYPEAFFKTLSAKKTSESEAIFSGEMTFLGQTKPMDVLIKFRGSANNMLTGKFTVGFAADASFKRSEFGLDKFIPLVGDDITIEVHAEFVK